MVRSEQMELMEQRVLQLVVMAVTVHWERTMELLGQAEEEAPEEAEEEAPEEQCGSEQGL